MLEGKAKIDFEKWYSDFNNFKYRSDMFGMLGTAEDFYRYLPFSMQSGVILEWLDSVGIVISTKEYSGFRCKIEEMAQARIYSTIGWATRQEALKEAIKKAVSIYNKD